MKNPSLSTIKTLTPCPSTARVITAHMDERAVMHMERQWGREDCGTAGHGSFPGFAGSRVVLGTQGAQASLNVLKRPIRSSFTEPTHTTFSLQTLSSPKHSAHTAQTLQYQIKAASQGNNPVKTHSRHTFTHSHWHTHTAAYSMWSTSSFHWLRHNVNTQSGTEICT